MSENTLTTEKTTLLCLCDESSPQLDYIKQHFFGKSISNIGDLSYGQWTSGNVLFFCGNINDVLGKLDTAKVKDIRVIKQFSSNFEEGTNHYKVIDVGEVPLNIHNVGVFFRKFFHGGKDYFDSLVNEHAFQYLTESNKESRALRKGIYLTKVEDTPDGVTFNLLRCSTNLEGPTDNYRTTDHEIVNKVNDACTYCFKDKVEVNHTLAQIYHNEVKKDDRTSRGNKAKISIHSDKTKDMPANGLLAFCTFYKDYSGDDFYEGVLDHTKHPKTDPYDYHYQNETVLTKLRFRLKDTVTDRTLVKKFDVVLYPNSLFMVPLVTNRLYTHEIVPSSLPSDKIPTRMGYVIRCSNTKAIHKNGKTYIIEGDQEIELEKPTPKGIENLKTLYYKENTTIELVHYDKIYFSLNEGDYAKPIV